MSATQQSERTAGPNGTPAPHRFRAATVEEALRQVRASLGEDAEIVEANRIRRGGIGGFFATELGVEVVALVPTDETGDAVDTGVVGAAAPAPTSSRPTDETVRSPLRSRQAWRQAIGDDLREPVMHGPSEQSMMPGLEAMLAEVSRSERSVFPGAPEPHVVQPTAPTANAVIEAIAAIEAEPGTGSPADIAPTTFAEHFLRELVQDAEELRRGTDRNRVLPPSSRTLADGSLLPHPPDPDEPPAPPRRRTAPAAGATAPLVAPDVLPGMPSPLPTSSAAPARGAPAKRASRSTSTRPRGAGSVPRAQRPAVAPEPAPELPLDSVVPSIVQTPTAESPSAATGALTELVDRCLQFAATADRATAPRKIALVVTLGDGGVMKLTVEMPRSR